MDVMLPINLHANLKILRIDVLVKNRKMAFFEKSHLIITASYKDRIGEF